LLEEQYDRAKQDKDAKRARQAEPISVEEMSVEDRKLVQNHAARDVWHWLTERYPDQPLTSDRSPQLDLGIDSIEWLTITLEIGQRAGVELSEEAIARIETVRDLLREVADAAEAGERFDTSVLAMAAAVLKRGHSLILFS
jgi:long-chain acyl-CoA synthetase